ncbi:tetratricopeptide repeat protein [Paractinoplanes maris]|uniref:tetratricopeptide repeat protein n=1 Tax=Paractinoplanes maris TaxID=1734446 RepID=UPI00202294DE|nr:tetratricopeptide repeat protein [Actinoplanes maris]
MPLGSDPRAAAVIAERCGRLPLALSLIAGHIAHTPGWTLTDHADRLDERHRDRRLDSGVEVALDLSYRHLRPGPQRALRLAALHPGQDFDPYAVAALTDADLTTARAWLDDLRTNHLLQDSAPGRHTLHDLVRDYAAGRAEDQDRPTERRAALTRLFDHCVATAAAAMDALHPVEDTELRARIPAPATPTPDLTDPAAALTWLDTERPTLVAVAAHTATHGWPEHTSLLARTLARYLGGGHHNDALIVNTHAYRATRRSEDIAGQAHALSGIGVAHLRQARADDAAGYFRQALALFRQVGDPAGQSRVLFNLGLLEERSGRYPAAIDYKQQALALDRAAGNRVGEAIDLVGLASLLELAGRITDAAEAYQEALVVSRAAGDRRSEGYALNGLGEIDVHAGRYHEAAGHLEQALSLYRQEGNRSAEAGALESLGVLHVRLGEVDRAVGHYQESLAIFREIGNQDNEAWLLNSLGEAARPDRTHHAAALAIAEAVGNRRQQARAHTGLGHAHHDAGEPAAAREHYEQALVLYTDLGVPEADEVRGFLDALPSQAAI